ncbi:MAG: class I SAM-dependent methyltransferase [Chloroflexus sp.]
MDHHEMVALIRDGVTISGGVWADLGAGTGNFTWALAEILGPAATIHAIDRDARAVALQRIRLKDDPPAATVLPRQADITQPLALPPLDGVLLANVLHFIRDQLSLLRRLSTMVRPGGILLIVEYEQTFPLPWNPYPLPFTRVVTLVRAAGFTSATRVGSRRSPSTGRILYAAAALCLERSR